jgi:hypothetical protein
MSRIRMGVLLGVPVLILTAALAYAAADMGKYTGEFLIYGGSAGDTTPPTRKDTKIHMTIDGPLALRLYRELGAASQQTECLPGDANVRRRRDMECELNVNTARATCAIGFDLRSGKSIGSMTAC